jgi:membrane-bound serine protease (ClpP class)
LSYTKTVCLFFLLFFSFLEASSIQSPEARQKELSSFISLGKNAKAGYISLSKDAPISNTTYLYVKYALEFFRKEGVSFVLLDLDTPGGEVFSALNIVQELKRMDAEYKIPVIALVDNWALSAGALIAYSCRFIATTTQGSMGAAEPVIVSQDGKMESASEKMVSALRTEFGKVAELYGRNALIAEAMCDRDIVLVLRDGKIISLLSDAEITESDLVINAKGKLLTLNAAEMQKFNVVDFIIPEGESGPLSGRTILQNEPFFAKDIKWLSYSNWKIQFFAFLSHPFVSSLLIFALIIGIYGEMQNPGFGFSAILALFSLSLILLSTFAVQVISFLELIFVLVGLILVSVDLFFVGFGFLAGLGILLFLGGLFSMLLPSLSGVPFSLDPSKMGFVFSEWIYRLSLFLLSLFIAFLGCIILGRLVFSKGFLGKKLVLQEPMQQPLEAEALPKIGERGKAFSDLRPLGKVLVSGRLYEAKTEGEFVEQESIVEVSGIKGKIIQVKEVL